jgi:glycosyltransferase involved in cell wall biosynthesis
VSELLSIIVPVFNEETTVRAVIERLLSIDLPVEREIVVINDGSTDGTRRVLDALPAAGDALHIVHAEVNGGKGRAIRTGLDRARGTIVAIQDADLELDPAQLATLVIPILRGETKAVYGSRFLNGSQGAPLITVAANRFLTGLTNLLYNARLTDMETCYKVMRTEVAQAITAKLLRAGHTIVERPVTFEPRSRAQGKKIGWRDGVKAVVVLAKCRFS